MPRSLVTNASWPDTPGRSRKPVQPSERRRTAVWPVAASLQPIAERARRPLPAQPAPLPRREPGAGARPRPDTAGTRVGCSSFKSVADALSHGASSVESGASQLGLFDARTSRHQPAVAKTGWISLVRPTALSCEARHARPWVGAAPLPPHQHHHRARADGVACGPSGTGGSAPGSSASSPGGRLVSSEAPPRLPGRQLRQLERACGSQCAFATT